MNIINTEDNSIQYDKILLYKLNIVDDIINIHIEFLFIDLENIQEIYQYFKNKIKHIIEFNNINFILTKCYIDKQKIIMKGQLV